MAIELYKPRVQFYIIEADGAQEQLKQRDGLFTQVRYYEKGRRYDGGNVDAILGVF